VGEPDVSRGPIGGSAETATDEFRVDEERSDGDVVVLAVHGEADMRSAPELRDRLSDAIDDAPSAVVVDLTDATFVDSMALGVFLNSMKRLHAQGGRFRVVAPRAEIRRIFEVTLLDRVFDLDATRREALSAAGAARVPPREGR
jgi:anti-sigma B factor antagonist